MMPYKTQLAQTPIFTILQKLADQNHLPTYLVGGYVRDLLLGKNPKDIDIVSVGNGIKLAHQFAEKIRGKVTIFKNFGTAKVNWKTWEIEFVEARKESYTTDSRKPKVSKGNLEDDLYRRDFTINALAISLNQATFGQLIDLFDGRSHLKKKMIQTPLEPNKTFSDDPLRMFRAIRFATKLNFNLTQNVYKSICANAKRTSILSKERIITEFNKILQSDQPSKGIKLLDVTNLLQEVLPEMQKLKGTEHIGKYAHKDNFKHTLQVLTNISRLSKNLWLRWAALLHDIAKPKTKRFDPKIGFSFHGHEELGARMVAPIFRRLKLPLNDKMHYVKKLVRLHLRPISLTKEVTDSAVRRLIYDAGSDLEDLMLLCKADITSKNQDKVTLYLNNLTKVEDRIKQVIAHDEIVNLQPVIDGYEIMQTYGLKPSKQVGMIRKALKEALLDGIVANNHSELYTYMLQIARKYDLHPIKKN